MIIGESVHLSASTEQHLNHAKRACMESSSTLIPISHAASLGRDATLNTSMSSLASKFLIAIVQA